MIPHGKSTETSIHDFLGSVQLTIEKKIKLDCEFFRFIKTIYCILLHKLDTYSIRGVANLLFKSYLLDWKQCNIYQKLRSNTTHPTAIICYLVTGLAQNMGHHQTIIQEHECTQKRWRSPPFTLKMYVECTRIKWVAKLPKKILKNMKYNCFFKNSN